MQISFASLNVNIVIVWKFQIILEIGDERLSLLHILTLSEND